MRKRGRIGVLSVLTMALVAIVVLGCSSSTQSGELIQGGDAEQVEGSSSGQTGEHGAGSEDAAHEEGPGPGEESGRSLALTDVYDTVRNGARLRMVYDQETDAFQGMVENTTGQTLCRVRVEVHLSKGTELGPTDPVNLPAGGVLAGELSAAGETFDGWSAHAETSPCVGGEGAGEHGTGSEGVGEHGGGTEGSGEHSEGSD